MSEDDAGGGEEPQPEHEQPQQGMEQGRAWPTSGVDGDPPHRGGAAGGEQQGAAPRRRGAGAAAAVAAAGGRGVWRRVASLVTLTAIVVATLVYYNVRSVVELLLGLVCVGGLRKCPLAYRTLTRQHPYIHIYIYAHSGHRG